MIYVRNKKRTKTWDIGVNIYIFNFQGKEPKLTSYHTSMKAAVDYVFFSSNCLDNVGVLALPPEGAITQTGGIPNEIFPSDHVSIKAVFSFR